MYLKYPAFHHGVMVCPARHRLAREYRKSVDAFRDAVYATKGLKGPEYESAYRASEKSRIAADQARIALERHRSEHKC